RPAGRAGRAPQGRPRPGLAGLRRLARELRQRPARPGRPDHGTLRALVLGPLELPAPAAAAPPVTRGRSGAALQAPRPRAPRPHERLTNPGTSSQAERMSPA